MSSYDVVIVGGGLVGATMALLFAQNTSLSIALVDAHALTSEWRCDRYEPRVSAISHASQRIFESLKLWDAICAKRVSPYHKMHVWDASGSGALEFDGRSVNREALGYIIEDSVMRSSLLAALADKSNVHCLSPLKLLSLNEAIDFVEIEAEDGQVLRAKLLIAADGGKSWVRDQAGIALKNSDYAHTAIVTTVETTLPHQRTARQRFLATGPLAFLPLSSETSSSIVWSTSHEEAVRLMALDEVSFLKELTVAFDHRLGEVVACQPRFSFPLEMRHAKQYVKSRLALVGDAAHTIHPLAGQGVNLGLLDAACLFEVIQDALTKQRDFASFATLRKYERWRKGDNAVMLAFVQAIKHLFCSDSAALRTFRNMGLNITNEVQFMKSFFVNYAAGLRGDLPEVCH